MNILGKHLSAVLAVLVILCIGLGCNLKSDSDWKQELHGKKLTMAKTSGSISDRIDIWFCGSGEYARKTQFSGYSGGGYGDFSMANENVELGNWGVESGTLILQSEKGETTEYSISQGMDNNVIKLNGTGYLVTTHNECR
ncbi:MAG: hypothetical protein K1X72_09470 [Pyrinomonadaceae bacterium]|nr:hypothetical protein [Pyrinomonadaceae bacterium]